MRFAPQRKYYVRSRDGKPRDDWASEIGSIPVPLGSRFQFSLDPLSRLARRRVRRLAFVEQAKLHSAGGCNFAARIRQTRIRLFDPRCNEERREKQRERERERNRDRETHEERRARTRRRLQQVVKYERRVVRFKHHLCLSIKFTRLSFQHCAGCHFASPITVSYSRSDSHPPSSRPRNLYLPVMLLVSFRSSRSQPRDRTNYPLLPFLLLSFGVYENVVLSSSVPDFSALHVLAHDREALCHPL